jgi:hypothetical protein
VGSADDGLADTRSDCRSEPIYKEADGDCGRVGARGAAVRDHGCFDSARSEFRAARVSGGGAARIDEREDRAGDEGGLIAVSEMICDK